MSVMIMRDLLLRRASLLFSTSLVVLLLMRLVVIMTIFLLTLFDRLLVCNGGPGLNTQPKEETVL